MSGEVRPVSMTDKLVRNAIFLLCMNLSSMGALFIFAVLLGRELGRASLGLYALFTALIMPFSYLVDLGQSTSLVQEICRSPRSTARILKNTLFLKLLLALSATLGLLVFSRFYFENETERALFWLFGLILFPRAVYSSFEAAFRAQQRMQYPMWIALFTAGVLVAGSILLLGSRASFAAIVAFLVFAEILRALFAWGLYRGKTGLNLLQRGLPIDLRECRNLARRSLPFFLMGLIGILYFRLDVILLATMRDNSEVGVLTAASSYVKFLRVVPSVVVAAFFPMISGIRDDALKLKHLTLKTLRLQLACSLPLACVVFLLADFVMAETFRFPEAGAVLRLFVWSIVPLSLYSTLVYAFFQAGKASWNIQIMSAALVVNLALNFVLIPTWGATAVAMSNVLSESFSFVVYGATFSFWVKSIPPEAGQSRSAEIKPEVSEFLWEPTP